MGETQEALEPKDKRGQGGSIHQVPKLQIGKYQAEANGLVGIHGKEKDKTVKYRAYNGR